MKKTLKFLTVATLLSVFASCEKNDDNAVPQSIEVQNFIWKGLNLYYLWQADVPNLSDSRFAGQQNLNDFLFANPNPESLFQGLLFKPASQFPSDEAVDRFSVITDNYDELEGILAGTTKNTGADFTLYYKNTNRFEVIGVVRYILPNSDASAKDIHRGDIFYAVNGEELNIQNLSRLLGPDSYTLNLADYDGGDFTPNGRSVALTKTVLSENPVYISEVIENNGHKIGYLMYNGFYPGYEVQLNNAFGQFKAQGVTDLVLDLRYNGGGSIDTAARLASMITGQFTGDIFAKEQWNAKIEAYYMENYPQTLFNYFTDRIGNNNAINSLGLNRVYILTTGSTASASELVINGLAPFIDVVQIGDKTIGKNVGSITLYDSPTFTKSGINKNHRYAMQPLVLKIVNKAGFGDYTNGLAPDELLPESLGNMGVLGDTDEPLLSAALTRIIGGGRQMPRPSDKKFDVIKMPLHPLENEMYLEKLPEGFPGIQ